MVVLYSEIDMGLYLVRNIVRLTTDVEGERNKGLHPCGIRVVEITEFRGFVRRW